MGFSWDGHGDIWLHVKTEKKVSEMKFGIYMDLWNLISFSNLCTYEEDFRCCFFPGIMLRLRCPEPIRSRSGQTAVSRKIPEIQPAEVGETKQAATQSDHIDQGQPGSVFLKREQKSLSCSMLAVS